MEEFDFKRAASAFRVFLQSDRHLGFELDKAPLMRFALIQLADRTYQFVWSHHHLLTDGWCLSILFKEVLAFYEAFEGGKDLSLPTPRPYRDYIVWLQQQDTAQAETFWRRSLQGFKTPTPLIKNSSVTSGAQLESYDEQQFQFSSEFTTVILSFARQHHLTLNTLIQGAWGLLLSRYSGEEDVVFGTTVSGRPPSLKGAELMVGLFINTLPVRVQYQQTELLPWLQQLQAQQVEREQYSYTSLVEIQGWSEVPREIPLFESLVVFENYPVDASLQQWKGNIEIGSIRAYERTNYPLTVVAGLAEGLSVRIIYQCDRFDRDTIERMMGHFQTLLEGMIANPYQQLWELPFLSKKERQQLFDWNNTKVDYPCDRCIHELFEAQVEKNPEAVALVFKEQQITYQELNCRANQLAHYLKKVGVGLEGLVGICIDRSLEMIIGLLGILKAGGAYVPLDPAYPTERLANILSDTGVRILLTQQRLIEKLSAIKVHLLVLDSDWGVISSESENNPLSTVKPDNLAYVMYTSGSTGQPKGVEVLHRGVVRLLFGVDYVRLDASQNFLQLANIAFDASTFEIWGALLHGAKCVLFPGKIPTFKELSNTLQKHKITILWLTSALFNAVIDDDPDTLSGISQLLIGGEALSSDRVRLAQKSLPSTQIINGYGPTESTTFTCCYPIPQLLDSSLKSIPIGRAIANTQTYILDRHLQPVPVGVAGELYIGGDGLARGYLNRPDLTAEKFISNPFDRSKFYKTGDLARYIPDGNIEFLGRIDRQVKLRGFRIEPEEIETVFTQHPQVNEAIVLVREISHHKHLVAYIVLKERSLNLSDLRIFLKEKLPQYMLPSAFVTLKALPLTPNGKVDRHALPMPEITAFTQNGHLTLAKPSKFELPRTPTEEILATMWAEVLGLKQVGIDDRFFELGGHSLLATQLTSRVRQTFSLELPLSSLFEAPTIREYSKVIEDAQKSQKGLQIPAIAPVSRSENIPLSFAQQRLWFLNQLETSTAYNMPTAVNLSGKLQIQALDQALNEIVQRHEALRTSFKVVNGSPIQVISPNQSLPLLLVNLQHLPKIEQSAEVERRAIAFAQQPFDLTQSLLLRVTLLQLGEESHVLLVNMHHIVSDGWSMGIFIRELSALYEAFSGGNSPLPPLPIQYADFAHWQRQWLTREVLDDRLKYWKQKLASAPTILELPTDRPRPPVQSFRGSTQQFQLDPQLTEQLKSLSQQSGATLFMTLLAAFAILLSRYSNQNDLVIGSPIANRNRSELESLIGFFVNTLMLRIDLKNNPTFGELLEQVRQTALDAYAHQDLPFEKLVEELQPDRDLERNPLVQVVFALQNAPTSSLSLPNLSINLLEFDYRSVRFDLEFHLWDVPEGLSGYFVYNTDLFNKTTIARLARHFQTLLQAVVANPEQHVCSLPLLSAIEQHKILKEWNHTSVNYPQNKCIHQLFEAQVEKSPDAVAVVCEEGQLTYQELNRKANQLAHHLQALGVKPETLVGICVDRSLDLIVGLLGILKAGGAYVPLDPSYPQARLSYMLSDSDVSVLVTQQKLVAIPEHQAHIVYLDTDWEVISRQSEDNLSSGIAAFNLAYVIYTSGSTGNPKGVLVAHKNLLNLVFWHQRAFEINSLDRATQLAKTAFDASVWEIWPYLAAGASIYLVKPELLSSPLQLQNWLVSKEISIAFLPTPLAEELLALKWSENIALKFLLVGGDRLHYYPSASLPFKVINNYGPTENTVVTTSGLIEEVTSAMSSKQALPLPPIGRPIDNTQVYILDSYLQPVPIGVAGELHIAGDSLARGYLNRPELTAEKFIPNPFARSRLYKTGDRARYLSDGNIEFLGRIDNQVKLRGFRIELGEIESVLLQHSAVQKAVVMLREDQFNNKRIVAYVVPNTNGSENARINRSQAEHLSHWQKLYEQTYSQSPTHQDLSFNIIGWNSSYTGQPIPEEEMREWVENTVERILQLQPKRVLEIGCGTGLLLSRIAPHCSKYWGTDYSAWAINYLQQLKKSVQGLDRVTLFQRMADDFETIDAEAFDTVILNSVVQYFPSVDYLLRVLEGSLNVMTEGCIFIGDVRSLPLLGAYYASVELEKSAATLSVEQLRQRVQKRVAQEEELVIDPGFFIAIAQRFPKITGVQILPKRGRDRNELTRFRYDVILHVGIAPLKITSEWMNWQKDRLTISAVRQLLRETLPEILAIKNIPDARVIEAVELVDLLDNEEIVTVSQLRSALKNRPNDGVDPEELWNLGQEFPYTVYITLNNSEAGFYEAIFEQNLSLVNRPRAIASITPPAKPWSAYANNPLLNNLTSQLIPKLRSFLQQTLPEYMVPSEFVMLSALPLTPNGKIDRFALPAPEDGERSSFVAPRDRLEWQLSQIWSEVLGIQSIGVRDNFFDLGGHSLLSVRLMAQIEQQFGKNLSLAMLFQHPTIEQLASLLRQQTDSLSWTPLVSIQPGGSKPPFFCVPGAGGNVIYLAHLARHLGSDQPFYGLQSLGLDGNSEPFTQVKDIATYYIKAIQTVQPQGPYFLGGHSFGAKVAFEMAQQLRSSGHEVALLAILDAPAPLSTDKPIGIDWDDATWLVQIARVVERLLGEKLEISDEILQSLEPTAQLNYFKERLQMVNLLPPDAGITQIRGLVEVYRANCQAHYELPQKIYPTQIILFRASEINFDENIGVRETLPSKNELGVQALKATSKDRPSASCDFMNSEILDRSTWGWSQFSSVPVKIYSLPGDHITMTTEPHVQVLAKQLSTEFHKFVANGSLSDEAIAPASSLLQLGVILSVVFCYGQVIVAIANP
ncbi:amino acid adenylation domain-containing protein [Candidatus Gracilibacteria bacterium]|nr:amino acid adenylation domain-containing protein [Candidatus Gracilibacteria bacterium]